MYRAVSSTWSQCCCSLWLAKRLTISKQFTAALHATNGSSHASAGKAALPVGSLLLCGWLRGAAAPAWTHFLALQGHLCFGLQPAGVLVMLGCWGRGWPRRVLAACRVRRQVVLSVQALPAAAPAGLLSAPPPLRRWQTPCNPTPGRLF